MVQHTQLSLISEQEKSCVRGSFLGSHIERDTVRLRVQGALPIIITSYYPSAWSVMSHILRARGIVIME